MFLLTFWALRSIIILDPIKICSHPLFFFLFLGLHAWHMEVPSLGVELELHLLAYTIATANQVQARSATYTIAHSNAGSLTHWVRPGIEPVSSWILVRFVSLSHNGNSLCSHPNCHAIYFCFLLYCISILI